MLESQGENGSSVASPLNQSRGLRLAAEQSRPDSHGPMPEDGWTPYNRAFRCTFH